MADFKKAYAVVRKNEGGYANNPADSGGETYKGIARKRWPNWKGWAIIDKAKRNSPGGFEFYLSTDGKLQQMVLDFYKVNFWDVLRLDLVSNQRIATELLDTAVNMGSEVSAEFLQQSLNATNRGGIDFPDVLEDKKIGPVTIAALNKHPYPERVLKLINCLQGARYVDIVRRRPKDEVFMPGWLARVEL